MLKLMETFFVSSLNYQFTGWRIFWVEVSGILFTKKTKLCWEAVFPSFVLPCLFSFLSLGKKTWARAIQHSKNLLVKRKASHFFFGVVHEKAFLLMKFSSRRRHDHHKVTTRPHHEEGKQRKLKTTSGRKKTKRKKHFVT